MISQREKVSKEIREVLQKRALEFDIILDDVSLTDLQFSAEFMHSIESKQVEQQNAEKEKFRVIIEEEMAKVKILRSEGEQEAVRLMVESLGEFGPGLVTLRKIEAATYIAKELCSNPNVTFVAGNTMNMLSLGGGP